MEKGQKGTSGKAKKGETGHIEKGEEGKREKGQRGKTWDKGNMGNEKIWKSSKKWKQREKIEKGKR